LYHGESFNVGVSLLKIPRAMVADAQQMWAITNGLRKRAKRWIPPKSLRTADRADLEGNG